MPEGEPLIRWDWLLDHTDDIAARLVEHVWLTVIAVVVGFAISFVLALIAVRRGWTYGPITAVTGILYTIPSLALFAILVPITGLSVLTAEIALVGYTLLILIRNIVAGIQGVPADVTEAAEGMGFSTTSRLIRVELPLALPVIVAGLRIATVTTIGLVTVAALIGQGGLGKLIEDGLSRRFSTLYITGAVLSVVLAVLADAGFVLLQRALTPWARARTAR
ncbi:MAG: ABC transporter permease [Chloroflexi bacterium]|nr:ABC transporter permease [Chloroflexota bacterium]